MHIYKGKNEKKNNNYMIQYTTSREKNMLLHGKKLQNKQKVKPKRKEFTKKTSRLKEGNQN